MCVLSVYTKNSGYCTLFAIVIVTGCVYLVYTKNGGYCILFAIVIVTRCVYLVYIQRIVDIVHYLPSS